jgi:uncharacterized protein YehS (DUF1456 family)
MCTLHVLRFKVLWAKVLKLMGAKTAKQLLAKMLAYIGITIAVDEAVDYIQGDDANGANAEAKRAVDNYLAGLVRQVEQQQG